MPDIIEELKDLKHRLPRGAQRELARRLGVGPTKVADGFDGFIKDQEFLSELIAQAHNLLTEENEEREEVADS